jgi:hypothetical protein
MSKRAASRAISAIANNGWKLPQQGVQ